VEGVEDRNPVDVLATAEGETLDARDEVLIVARAPPPVGP